MAAGETLTHALKMSCSAVARAAIMIFCVVIPNGGFVRCPQEGNLISIGPGMYPSNRTLDGGGRSILVLGSCEFMHNGTLSGLNYYVASPDWMILQIWRPVSMDAVSMMLVYERMIEPNASVDDITQLRFDDEELHVLEGDRIGFTKLNHTFPIPYVFNPQMSADLWYNRVPAEVTLPNISDVITFEEMGFPYHFSVTVTFKAQVSRSPPVVLRPYRKASTFNDVMKPSSGDDKNPHDVMMGDAAYDVNAKHKKVNSVYKPTNKEDSIKPLPEKESSQDDAGEVIDIGQATVSSHVPSIDDLKSSRQVETSLNHTVRPLLTGDTGRHTGGAGVTTDNTELTSVDNSSLFTTAESVSSQPSRALSADPAEAAVVSTAGPKFIFDTGMQTFSNLVQTTEEPTEEDTEEFEATSLSSDATSSLTQTAEDDAEDDVEVTSESDIDGVATTDILETQSSSKTVGKTKGLPNDTTD